MNKRILVIFSIAVLLLSGIFTGCNNDPGGDDDPPKAKVIILQVAGTGTATDGNISHSFVELYNPGAETVDITGWALYYRSDIGVESANFSWDKLDLSGTIPAKSSYLILGKKMSTVANLKLDDLENTADKTWTDKVFSNRGFSILLRSETGAISNTVEKPTKENVPGYVDLVGVYNDIEDPAKDQNYIKAFEGTAALGDITKQKSARRKNITDTNNNFEDFQAISFRPYDGKVGVTDEQRDYYKPHTTKKPWETGLFDSPAYPPPLPPSEGLMILQVYGTGITPDPNDGGVTHSFIELYNNSDTAVLLGTYSIQIAPGKKQNGKDAEETWVKYDLSDSIPAHGSYFIRGNCTHTDQATNTKLLVLDELTPDLNLENLQISNRAFKVALVSNQTLITAVNPFNTDGEGTTAPGFVDLLGAVNSASNDAVDGFETAVAAVITKQASARRKNLTDTDNNSYDFVKISFNNDDLTNRDKYKPRNTKTGSWTPEF
jgi:hypothetical protein